jgi:hypothetical protein
MSQPHSAVRSALATLAGILLIGGAFAATAQADSYGELAHFGEKGTQRGQFNEPELALGVNPSDNSVFVVDANKGNNGFRLQKFVEKSGKYESVASASFKPKGEGGGEPDEIEGVAIDPELKRAYVLAVQERGADKGVDSEDLAAGVLLAFNTEPTGSTLEPAPETTEGVLDGQGALGTDSKEQGVALLEPSGIAVDPTTHDVIILATKDRGKKPFEKEATVVLQRVKSNGTLGAKYVDSRSEFNPETGKTEEKGYFEECECVSSPVVSKTGHVYVVGEETDEIVEIPASFNGATKPTPVVQLECELLCPEERLTEFPGQEPYDGSQLAIGGEGRIYASAKITLESGGDQQYGGAVAFNEAFGEVGWTGGQSPASQAGKCIVNDLEAEQALAAGKEEKIFMLDRNPSEPRVVEFGPNGSGCPQGTVAGSPAITAKAGGVEVEPVPITDSVTLSSSLAQANALSVEWEFGDGTTQTVSTRQQETTEVQHTFTKTGKLTVKETIHTDNLATPVLKAQRTVDIVGPPSVTTGEAKVAGTTATLEGTVNPNGQKVTKCEFEYGTTTEYKSAPVKCAKLPGEGETPVTVTAQVAGLEKHTLYHFRLVAENGKGPGTGSDQTFTSGLGPVPIVSLEAVGATQTTATLNAKVNPNGVELTDCHFDYGTTLAFGTSAKCSSLPHGETAVAVSAGISGLTPNTTYHVRIVATNANGTATSTASEFTTKPEEVPCACGGGGNEGGGGGGGGDTGGGGGGGGGQVLSNLTSKPAAVPNATIAGSSTTVSKSGSFTLKVSCPVGESTCSGTVTLKTLKAVVASAGREAKSKAAILTLASGSFSVGGGQTKTLTLHLSAKGRLLLARTHSVLAHATVLAHDPAGATHTSAANLSLRAAKPKHH